ncbi:hypothetical protein HBN50_08350 [Halobacteriovorax sp. GB3]|uniref:hypothetical protein n=1 Tax=Halobacteriovorax sp. GB3 TaxID=2719615 RepID=UPI00235EF029|nr:hypothetical protein [Halobacteriovorax sp. GB3]MDD0853104.1 hypothetical protein [Halobacteriovorax sp. GB3]
MKHLCFISLFTLCLSASAEYRVYQYQVKSKMERYSKQGNYLVTSTLDPVSYLSYHGGSDSIRIDLLRSWTCKGYTGNSSALCKAPLENIDPFKEEVALQGQ